jgi:hypothetical protein
MRPKLAPLATTILIVGLFSCSTTAAQESTTTISIDPTPMEIATAFPSIQELEKSAALNGVAGDYEKPQTSTVDLDTPTMKWTRESLGGVQILYKFNMDTSAEFGIHDVQLTIRAVKFQDVKTATDVLFNHPDRLKDTPNYRWTFVGNEFARNTYQIRVKKAEGKYPGVSEAISAKGKIILSVTLEDQDRRFDWEQTCQMILLDTLSKLEKYFPSLVKED